MSEKNKKIKDSSVKDSKTEKAADNVKTAAEGKMVISQKNMAIIITAAVLAVILIAVAVFLIVDYVKKDKGFDYIGSNLSQYIEFTEDYKNYKLEVDIASPKDIDIDVAILSLLAQDKGDVLNNGGLVKSPITIGAGDVVRIWYRGYLIGEDGEEIEVTGMSNFGDKDAYDLEIGSGSFIPGFELGLWGVNTGEYSKFVKITEGTPQSDQIAYVSFTRVVGEDTSTKLSRTSVRMDLSTDIDATFGAGFKARIMQADIGDKMEFAVQCGDDMYNYTNLTVDFVTECETNPVVVEAYFPYDYSKANLRNETAFFEVYVEGVVDYENVTFTEDYLQSKIEEDDIGITVEELNSYEGANLIEKYRAYAKKVIDDMYEEEYNDYLEAAIWDYYGEITKVKKYPTNKVDDIYNDYVDDVYYQFDVNSGMVYNSSTGSYKTYEDIDSYARAYLGLSSSADWKSYLYSMSQNLVKERLVMYYIMDIENLMPTDAEFDKVYEETRQEYLDEYVKQYLDYEGKTKEDFADEAEYQEYVEARKEEIFSYYDEEYFKETAYYNIVIEAIREWPEVSTFDDRRAYPLDK